MARRTKDSWLGARVEQELTEQVEAYIDATGMTKGDFVRLASKEYLWAHPVRNSAGQLEPVTPQLKEEAQNE